MQLVALPPDGRMFAFNDEAKKIYRVDMSRFSLPGLYRNQYEANKTKGQFFATGNKAKIGGLNAFEFANYRKKDLASVERHAHESSAKWASRGSCNSLGNLGDYRLYHSEIFFSSLFPKFLK